jgi:DNA-binding CsgD family transcriptional regulator
MTREERALQLIGILYQAALDPSGWNDFVKGLSEAYRGAPVRLALIPPGSPPEGQHYMIDLSEEYAASFLEHFTGGLPWSSELIAEYASRWSCLDDLFSGVELRRTEFYQAWMKPQKLPAVWPIGVPILDQDGLPIGGLTVFRRAGGQAFREDEIALGELLVPHLRAAVCVGTRLSGVQRERLALAEVMDRLPLGVILFDRKRQPIVTNRSAQQILALEDGFALGPNGPYAADPHDNKALRKLVESVFEPEPGREIETGGFIAVKRPSGKRAFVVMATPLLAAPPGSESTEAVVSVHIADPETGQLSATEVLETVYSLTTAEADLVRLLAGGHSLEAAAELRGVTMNTVRSQLKQVFAKTDTKRQAELVRLVLTGVGAIRDS